MRAGRLGGMGLAAFLLFGGTSQGQDSLNVTKVGQLDLGGVVNAVALSGNYVCAVGCEIGMCIVDVSDPATPTAAGWYNSPEGYCEDVAVSGNYAYVADWTGLRVVDISEPSLPVEVGYCPEVSDGHKVEISGAYAYVFFSMSEHIYITDISDSTTPVPVGQISPGGWGAAIAVSGTDAYVPEILGYFRIWNVSDPAQVQAVGGCILSSGSSAVDFSDSCVFVAHDLLGLQVINATSPAAPFLANNLPVPGGGIGLTVVGSHAYMTAGEGGLRIINIEDPENPYESGYYVTANASDLAVSGPYAYVAEGEYLGIYDCSNAQPVGPLPPIVHPSSFRFHPCHPNPFNPTTVASFELRVPSHVSLRVHDTAGRLITTLTDGWREAGRHQVVFDGSNLPSGIYLARITAGEFSQTQKLVLMK